MKKHFLALAVAAGVVFSCSNEENNIDLQEVNVDMSDFYLYTDPGEDETTDRGTLGKNCSSMAVLNEQLLKNPNLYQQMYDVELHSRKFMSTLKPGNGNGGGNGGGGNGGGGGPGGAIPGSQAPFVFGNRSGGSGHSGPGGAGAS